MRRFTLSVIFLMLVGGTGFTLPDLIHIYDIYSSQSSGSVVLSAAYTEMMSNAARVFRSIFDDGYTTTTVFKNQHGVSSVRQADAALQFRGVVLPNGSHNSSYNVPRSGSLDLFVTDVATSDPGPRFTPMSDGGFGPSPTSFQNADRFSLVNEAQPALQLKDRWLFDFLPGGHPRHPHHSTRRRHLLSNQ